MATVGKVPKQRAFPKRGGREGGSPISAAISCSSLRTGRGGGGLGRRSDLLPEIELIGYQGPDVFHPHQAFQKWEQGEQLLVRAVVEPAFDGDPVVHLEPKRLQKQRGALAPRRRPWVHLESGARARGGDGSCHLRGVVDDDDPGQIAAENREVLHVVPLHEEARLAVDAVAEELPLRVQDVEQLLGVDALAGREDDDLEEARHPLHEVPQMRAAAHVDGVLSEIELDREREVRIAAGLERGMHQRLCPGDDSKMKHCRARGTGRSAWHGRAGWALLTVQIQHEGRRRATPSLLGQQHGAEGGDDGRQLGQILDERVGIKVVELVAFIGVHAIGSHRIVRRLVEALQLGVLHCKINRRNFGRQGSQGLVFSVHGQRLHGAAASGSILQLSGRQSAIPQLTSRFIHPMVSTVHLAVLVGEIHEMPCENKEER